MTDAPGASSGSAFLNRKNHALDVDRQQFLYVLVCDFAQAGSAADTSVCEQDVYFSLLVFDLAIKAIQVFRLGHVSLHCRHVAADVGYGRVQFGLSAPRDEDVSAFDNEGFRRSEADAGVAAGDDGDLSFKISHKFNSSRQYRSGVTQKGRADASGIDAHLWSRGLCRGSESVHTGCFNAVVSTGSFRKRLPVAAKIALVTAGTMADVPGSPIPPGDSELWTMWTSMAGASFMRRIW